MGNWSMGGWFWIKFIISLPIRLLLSVPFWIIKPFSPEMAFRYYEKNFIYEGIDRWLQK